MSEIFVHTSLGGQSVLAGTLFVSFRHGRTSSVFSYEPSYIADPAAYPLEPALPLVSGAQAQSTPLPRSFSDAAPDRWGRRLIEREHRTTAPGTMLGEADYLLGVSDTTRQGALRLSLSPTGPFLAPGVQVPKLVSLPALLAAARSFEKDEADSSSAVKLLLDAGASSLGGARPKAAVSEDDRLLIAKFPHRSDEWDVMAWEGTALDLAASLGISTPPHRLIRLADTSVLVSQRFDRAGQQRLGYISAMSLLEAQDGQPRDYVELAEAIPTLSASPGPDLRELFTRILLSIALHNTDDHLRNHGFVHDPKGWRLSPLFDVNPNPALGQPRATSIGGAYNRDEELPALLDNARAFGISRDEAGRLVEKTRGTISQWREAATHNRITAEQQRQFSPLLDDNLLTDAGKRPGPVFDFGSKLGSPGPGQGRRR